MARACRERGHEAFELPLADGGEGTLDAFGGANRLTRVAGPTGEATDAPWRLDGARAVIEMAAASGQALISEKDPLGAKTTGCGQLIAQAAAEGATEIVVTLGGSATTDGGLRAVEAVLERYPEWPKVDGRDIRLIGLCDVETLFVDAARVFGPQKGASDDDIHVLTERLESVADRYRKERCIDVTSVAGSGAAGGLGGGVVALGGELSPGFTFVADAVGLSAALAGVDLVITGEGRLDAESFHGKVVGGVAEAAEAHGVGVAAVVGTALVKAPFPVAALDAEFGAARAFRDTIAAIEEATGRILDGLDSKSS